MDSLPFTLPNKIVAPRCLARPYRAGDGEKLYSAIQESREHLIPTMAWSHEYMSPEQTEELVQKFSHQWQSRGSDLTLPFLSLDETRLLGGTGFHRINWDLGSFEIGYWIRPTEEGKGLVTELVAALCDFAFTYFDANRIHIKCNSDNQRSANVARRLGFVQEGRFLNAAKKPSGELVDQLSFGLTPAIWELVKPIR